MVLGAWNKRRTKNEDKETSSDSLVLIQHHPLLGDWFGLLIGELILSKLRDAALLLSEIFKQFTCITYTW